MPQTPGAGTSFPTALDNFTMPTQTNYMDIVGHAGEHSDVNAAAMALEAKLGIGATTPSLGALLVGTGSGATAWTTAITLAALTLTGALTLNNYAAHSVLVSEASSAIVGVAPSATSGVALVSQGNAADPAFGLVVVAGGGTGLATLSNHAVLVGAGTATITQIAVGGANSVLQGAAGADPAFTATPTLTSLTLTGNMFHSQNPVNGAATTVASSGTIAIAQTNQRVTTAGNVTGIIITVGTVGGQELHIINESANTLTFAAAGTSNVAGGVSVAVQGSSRLDLTWDSVTALWYPIIATGSGSNASTLGGFSPSSTPAGGSAVVPVTASDGTLATTWITGGVGMQNLKDNTLGGSAASITFSSISASYKGLEGIIQARTDGAGTSEEYLYCQLNGDTGNNYAWAEIYAYTGLGTTPAASQSAVSQAQMALGRISEGGTTASTCAGIEFTIANYAGTTFTKQVTTKWHASRGVATLIMTGFAGGGWQSTAAINAIKVYPQTAVNLVTGTRFTLQGEL